MAEKKITLRIGETDFGFNVTTDDFNRYINEVKPDDKVLPSKRFLRRALIDKEQQEELDGLIDRGHALTMTGKLIEEFQGEIEIEVKK